MTCCLLFTDTSQAFCSPSLLTAHYYVKECHALGSYGVVPLMPAAYSVCFPLKSFGRRSHLRMNITLNVVNTADIKLRDEEVMLTKRKYQSAEVRCWGFYILLPVSIYL